MTMTIECHGHNLELTDALKTLIKEKSDKLKRHFSNITQMTVTLSLEHDQHIAEGHVKEMNNFECHAVGESTDMYQSIDLMINKLDKQLIKYKEKRAEK
jgi:putative sigma-54 modulation protein